MKYLRQFVQYSKQEPNRRTHSFCIAMDALDESSPRTNLLNLMRDLSSDARFAKIKLLSTSREYLDIEAMMTPIPSRDVDV
jgi:hypothetical protein